MCVCETTVSLAACLPVGDTLGRKCSKQVGLSSHDYHCQHQSHRCKKTDITRNGFTSKRTGCVSKMSIVVKKTRVDSRYRGKDNHIASEPTKVYFNWAHNHPLESANILKFRDMGSEAAKGLIELFHAGYTPLQSLKLLDSSLQVRTGEDYTKLIEDRHHLPDIKQVRRLYTRAFQEKYGGFSVQNSFPILEEKLKLLCEDKKMKVAVHYEEHFVAAITTPFVERVHSLVQESGEIMFMDAGDGIDRCGFRVFLVMTYCPLGGLPLGCFLTTSDSSLCIEKGLRLLLSLLPDGTAFAGRNNGPKLIITDQLESEKNALSSVFGESEHLVNVFHILQAFWNFLWRRESIVERKDKPRIFVLLKGLLFSTSGSELEAKFKSILVDPTVSSYPEVCTYFQDQWARKSQWSLTDRNNVESVREASMLVLKNQVLRRHKVHNAWQLADHCGSVVSDHFVRHIRDILERDCSSPKHKSFPDEVSAYKVIKIDEDIYQVEGEEKDFFVVNDIIGVCTCPKGSSGAACQHQFSVKMFHGNTSSFPVLTEKDRCKYHELVTGKKNLNVNLPLPTDSFRENSPLDDSEEFGDLEDEKKEPSNVAHLQNILDSVLKKMQDKFHEHMKHDPSAFLKPLKKFAKSLDELDTIEALASAFASFGKRNSVSKSNWMPMPVLRLLPMTSAQGEVPVQRSNSNYVPAEKKPKNKIFSNIDLENPSKMDGIPSVLAEQKRRKTVEERKDKMPAKHAPKESNSPDVFLFPTNPLSSKTFLTKDKITEQQITKGCFSSNSNTMFLVPVQPMSSKTFVKTDTRAKDNPKRHSSSSNKHKVAKDTIQEKHTKKRRNYSEAIQRLSSETFVTQNVPLEKDIPKECDSFSSTIALFPSCPKSSKTSAAKDTTLEKNAPKKWNAVSDPSRTLSASNFAAKVKDTNAALDKHISEKCDSLSKVLHPNASKTFVTKDTTLEKDTPKMCDSSCPTITLFPSYPKSSKTKDTALEKDTLRLRQCDSYWKKTP